MLHEERADASSGGRHLVLDDSTVTGRSEAAVRVQSTARNVTDGTVELRNHSRLVGENGVAIDATSRTTLDLLADASDIVGDIHIARGASATVADGTANLRLQNGAVLTGAIKGSVTAAVTSSSIWTMATDSEVNALELSDATIAFASPPPTLHRSLVIHGDLSGTGGLVAVQTNLDQGGDISAQGTDRLLIEGNVSTTGATTLAVSGSGSGALTDVNQNGVVDANEGISLVQVAGASRADAFTLRGGYVAAGPWQYRLHAFGPGAVDQAQNALQNGAALAWDYRLGNTIVCESDCEPVDPVVPPVDPVDPPVEPPVEPPVDPNPGDGGREAVVPQMPSYLSAPAALLTYGDMLNDGLHQRLGEVRTGISSDPVGGEVFARYLGGQLRYTSNLSFKRFGYDFDQQVNALQFGGSLVALDGDNGSLRAGWAADHGTTRVTPKAVDGNSSAKYRANGVSAWITWQHGGGLWVDGVIGSTRYRGDVGTDLRGSDVGRVRANGWTMSVEAGMPMALGGDWTVEPRFQLKHQALNFRNFTDGDGLLVRLGTAKQTSARIGAQVSRKTNVRFMPYASLDLTHTSHGDPGVDVSSADWHVAERFGSGRVGNAYRVAAGAVSQLTDHVQVYGQGTYQHFVGSYGMRGWAGNLGVRVTF
ncbi:autotransporter outer membrane beta-barrel domain-containing protein [Luteibacter sp. UNCMF331Sha3.1]|uniref:autotransporter family protein n=1 Tax=Luteibacter sp. UNCMF331Sha3.1 TaxID=1502760 RepID=UPI00147B891F|nr:autotransporter outer membrane beta-barrel domain-containing protein [Luteibacter sp. UNCMF331Sha3.1]